MINDVKSISNYKNKKIETNNILKNNFPSFVNNNEEESIINNINQNNNFSLLSRNNKRRILTNSAKIRNLENKSIGVDLNRINQNINKSNQKSAFIHLSANFVKRNNILTPKIIRPRNMLIRNKSFNLVNNLQLPKLNLKKTNINNNRIYYIGGDFSYKNKYFSDLINKNKNDNNKCDEKNDMETVDIKIEQIAKDINLFQNERKNRNYSLNYDSSNKNNFTDDEYNNVLPLIKSDNSTNLNSKSISRISSGIPRSRLYSGKFTNNTDILDSNKNLNKKNFKRIISPSNISERFNIIGTNVMSPICQKARDIFLYKKIFYYFGGKKVPHIMKKFINNKLNICYADNEKQFEKKLIQINAENKRKGKFVYHKVGKAETEKRAASMQKRVEFIRKIFDYAYPDILICKIKNKSDMDKREIRENKIRLLKKQRELKEKLKIKKYKSSLHDSIIIKKIN